MTRDLNWVQNLELDINFGYLGHQVAAPRQYNPRVVLNSERTSVLRVLREELARCRAFTFSVAFISPRAIALLKQELVDFGAQGRIVTSDYLAFNSPAAFEELYNLKRLGVDVRIHTASAFHPKGYIFEHPHTITAMMGSSNLTESALAKNHEWNLKVSAAPESDLASQLSDLVATQVEESIELTREWMRAYAEAYVPPARVVRPVADTLSTIVRRERAAVPEIVPNGMQAEALEAITAVRRSGETRAIVISATGTGKTILSALDVRTFSPRRMLFIVHREQILDRTIQEYRQVLGGPAGDYGKLTGSTKQTASRYLFATVQTLSQTDILSSFLPDAFDYVIVDEAHRAGARTYQRVLDHFTPQFLLGMTATPERSDAINVFELFDYNVPYEIRLNKALEEGMLSPFHYYGVADVTFQDGHTTTDETELKLLISPERVDHAVGAIEIYGQAGVPPRGLIFCSGKDEARHLSDQLNTRALRGELLRTVALTGDDPVAHREAMVAKLEAGELDYILTVDVFNEGVDIPSVNQVIMLRQTQSAIVFVQQLGRGLRKAPGKEYLVVIDFIGNYANNFMIPIALFGDESLNKEMLRERLISAEESGVLPALSSVRFDRIAQERVLRSITSTALDSIPRLKTAVEAMRNRVGGVPRLRDFYRFGSVDPVLLATKRRNYPRLIQTVLKVDPALTSLEDKALELLSSEVLAAKRPHEILLLQLLLREGSVTPERIGEVFASAQAPASARHIAGAVDSLTLEKHPEADQKRYVSGLAARGENGVVSLMPEVLDAFRRSERFRGEVDDIIETGIAMVLDQYENDVPFTRGRQYSRKDATRLLGLPRKWASTIYGYKVDAESATCPIFVTLHKSADVGASTAYEDGLLDPSTVLWYTRSRRTLASEEVRAIVDNAVELHVFVKKDDAEGSDFYYLGQATSHDAEQATMVDADGARLPVVRMHLRFGTPIETALYDYFHPSVTS